MQQKQLDEIGIQQDQTVKVESTKSGAKDEKNWDVSVSFYYWSKESVIDLIGRFNDAFEEQDN